jgi:hypothetical protein
MYNMPCKYSEIFGKTGEGAHSFRILDVAIIDVMFTIIGAYLIHRFVFPQYPLLFVTIMLFALGIVMHRLFCVRTTIDKLFFK